MFPASLYPRSVYPPALYPGPGPAVGGGGGVASTGGPFPSTLYPRSLFPASAFPGLDGTGIVAVATLALTPGTASAIDATTTISLTATLSGSSASLTASVAGGGTLSTAAPTSGTPFTYTPPTAGAGSATVTVTDATDGLAASSTIFFSPAAGGSDANQPRRMWFAGMARRHRPPSYRGR